MKTDKRTQLKKIHSESTGCLNKYWYNMSGYDVLVKGNTISDKGACYEPFSEVIAYYVAKSLGLDAVDYTIGEKKWFPDIVATSHVSICQRIPLKEGEQLISYHKLMGLLGKKNSSDLDSFAALKLNYRDLYRMLIFDAIIGNEDRHLNNWDYIVSRSGIRPAPLFDHGASLFAMVPEEELDACNDMGSDTCKNFATSHTKVLELLKERKVQNLFDVDYDKVLEAFHEGLDKVRPYLSNKRIEKIETAFELRMEKYLLPFIGKEKTLDETDAQRHDYR